MTSNELLLFAVRIIVCLAQMRTTDVKQQLNVVVVKGVEDGFSRAGGLDQTDLAKMLEVVRDSGLRHVHDFGEVADAQVG